MKLIDFAATSSEEIPLLIKELSPMQIRANSEQLSETQVGPAIHALREAFDAEWREKMIELVLGLTSRSKIEAVGRALSVDQAAYLLTTPHLNKKNTKEELTAILVGLPHQVFLQLIQPEQTQLLNVLKQEVNTEAVQHHLTVLSHEMANQLQEYENQSLTLNQAIRELTIDDLGREDICAFTNQIDELSAGFNQTISQIGKLMQLAWNTQRADIIDKLSSTKETATRYRNQVIGTARSFKKPPTGLYLELEKRLFSVYGDSENPADIEAIKDDEPAIEALVKLSIWYIHDYWEIGLLPHIKSEQEITSLRKERRDNLIQIVNQNLAKICLFTASDLKAARIFSKKSLQEYIAKQAHRLP